MEWIYSTRRVYYIIFGFAQACGLVSVILLISLFTKYGSLAWKKENDYYIHGFLMLTGLVYLQGTAISAFRVLNAFDRLKVKIAHMILQIGICVMNIIGLIAIFDLKSTHLDSLHGWCGLVTVIMFFAQAVFSFLCFFYPKGSPNIRETMMPYHRNFGLAIFSMAVITASIKIDTIKIIGEQAQGIWIGILALMFAFTIFITVKAKKFRRENVYD